MRGSIRFIPSILAMIGCAVVFLALAQVNPPAGVATAVKIGVVNSNAVLNQTAEGKRELTQLNQFVEGKQKEYEGQAAELQKLRDQLAQSQSVNPDARLEMQRAIEEKELTLKRFQEDAQREVQRRQEEVFGQLQEKLQKSIQDYAEKNGYQLILQRDDSQAYVSPSLEITQDIVSHYNQQHPATASAFRPNWRQTPRLFAMDLGRYAKASDLDLFPQKPAFSLRSDKEVGALDVGSGMSRQSIRIAKELAFQPIGEQVDPVANLRLRLGAARRSM